MATTFVCPASASASASAAACCSSTSLTPIRMPPTYASLARCSLSRASPRAGLTASLVSHVLHTLSARGRGGSSCRAQISPCKKIYDTMESIKSPFGTFSLGYNNAGFLLGAGTKGLRVARPLTRIALHSPAGAARGQHFADCIQCPVVSIKNAVEEWGSVKARALIVGHINGSIDLAKTDTSVGGVYVFPLYAKGKVVRGFGRGSKQMGIPTANLNPEDLPQEVRALAKGVYFGWAQVRASGMDERVHKMVMNIGNRPTFADSEAVTVEVHIMHKYEDVDFYGEEAAIVVLGFIRPELKFKSLDSLVERIQADVGTAQASLEDEALKFYQTDPFFKT